MTKVRKTVSSVGENTEPTSLSETANGNTKNQHFKVNYTSTEKKVFFFFSKVFSSIYKTGGTYAYSVMLESYL